MKEIKTEQGFLVLEMTVKEAQAKGCGFSEGIICDFCNDLYYDRDIIYYVAVLDYCLCPFCFKEWVKTAKRYEEDIPYEEESYKDMLSR